MEWTWESSLAWMLWGAGLLAKLAGAISAGYGLIIWIRSHHRHKLQQELVEILIIGPKDEDKIVVLPVRPARAEINFVHVLELLRTYGHFEFAGLRRLLENGTFEEVLQGRQDWLPVLCTEKEFVHIETDVREGEIRT